MESSFLLYIFGADDVEVYNFFFGNNDSYESIYINYIPLINKNQVICS